MNWVTGIHDGIPAADYFALAAVSRSGLQHIRKSPLHFFAANLDPAREKPKETRALFMGTAIHASLLEPDRYAAEYRARPEPEDFPGALVTQDDYKKTCEQLGLKVSGRKDELKLRIKEAGATHRFFDDIETEFDRYRLLTRDEMYCVGRITANFRKSVTAKALFRNGKTERTLIWDDPETGVLCKARLDWLADDFSLIVDPKSTEDASPAGFAKSVANFNYHRQAAWYTWGVEVLTGRRPMFVFPAYEKSDPFAAAYYYATDEMIEQGRAENRRDLNLYAQCLRSNAWPGYSDELQPIDLPSWARSKSALEATV